ncbi:MAG: GNAT family N-acetyltransferase [Hellea sp.]
MREEIRTERLVLRQLTLDDASAISKLGSDKDISRMTGSFPHPFPLLSAEFKIMHMKAQNRRGLAYPYAITIDGGELMGICDLFRRSADAVLEIGYWLGKPYWGKGYSTEAAIALMKEARDSLGVSSLIAGVFSDNPASIRVLQKLGFKLTGEEEMYFSIGRMEKAHSLSLRLDFEAPQRAAPLRSNLQFVKTA